MKQQFPEKYEAARRALAQASKLDEVKTIRDKAVAMQMYGRMADDPDLVEQASLIHSRSVIRFAELIEEAKAAGRISTGSRNQLDGKKAGTSKGQGKAKAKKAIKVSGSTGPSEPEKKIIKLSKFSSHLVGQARQVAKMSKPERETWVDKNMARAVAGMTGDKAAVKEARADGQKEKKVKRAAREKDLAAKIKALPDAKFGVIVADPGWKFKPQSEATGMDRSAENHYTCEELDEIKAQKVPSIAAADCVLFLWATVPMLPEALVVMEAWGFKYKSSFVWVKDRVGTGYWNRNKHELLLVGTKGKPVAPAPGTQWDSVIEAPIGKHSAKPEKVLEMIEGYYPNVPKIELNRRGEARPRWAAHGNEAEPAAGNPAEVAGEPAAPKAVKAKAKKKAATEAAPGAGKPKRSRSKKKPPVEPMVDAVGAAAITKAEPDDGAHVHGNGNVTRPGDVDRPVEVTHVDLEDPPTRPEPMFRDELDQSQDSPANGDQQVAE